MMLLYSPSFFQSGINFATERWKKSYFENIYTTRLRPLSKRFSQMSWCSLDPQTLVPKATVRELCNLNFTFIFCFRAQCFQESLGLFTFWPIRSVVPFHDITSLYCYFDKIWFFFRSFSRPLRKLSCFALEMKWKQKVCLQQPVNSNIDKNSHRVKLTPWNLAT